MGCHLSQISSTSRNGGGWPVPGPVSVQPKAKMADHVHKWSWVVGMAKEAVRSKAPVVFLSMQSAGLLHETAHEILGEMMRMGMEDAILDWDTQCKRANLLLMLMSDIEADMSHQPLPEAEFALLYERREQLNQERNHIMVYLGLPDMVMITAFA